MKVLMLGWEFPPMVSGGLGVACYGLVKALNSMRVNVMFVLPKPLAGVGGAGGNGGGGMRTKRLLPRVKNITAATARQMHQAVEVAALAAAMEDAGGIRGGAAPEKTGEWVTERQSRWEKVEREVAEPFEHVRFVPVDVLLEPYLTPVQYQRRVTDILENRRMAVHWEEKVTQTQRWIERAAAAGADGSPRQPPGAPAPLSSPAKRHYIEEPEEHKRLMGPENTSYAGDLFEETERYGRLALAVAKGESFSLIHAHDWMTFEAAMAVAALSGRPFVVQIHSTELDRAGAGADARIMEIERQGMTAADRVIAVSYRTKTQLIEKYGIDPRKIEVVYNAGEAEGAARAPRAEKRDGKEKTVLFLGRLTEQKGPDHFLRAAAKVLMMEPAARFVLAGKGEMLEELKQLAEDLGIAERVQFAGFLKKNALGKMLQEADVYVMPSVSEPFGIAPLDAIAHDVPVIISKQSGVAEVLRHVLKVDFWDTEDLASKILAVLHHPALAQTLREQGEKEARQLSWNDSARRIMDIYEELTRGRAVRGSAV